MFNIVKFSTFVFMLMIGTADAGTIRVFSGTGQSNNAAYGEVSGPAVSHGNVLKYQGGAISDANDPVGQGTGGSIWPAFLQRMWESSSIKIGIINTSIGASSQVAAAASCCGYWDVGTSGNLYVGAKASIIAGISAFGADAVYSGNIDGQGETDADQISAGTITKAQFKASKKALIAQWRTDFGDPTLPWYFIRLGSATAAGDPSGWKAVREAQMEIAQEDTYTHIIFWGADTFHARGLIQTGTVHYTQAGYNEAGRMAAKNLLRGNFEQISGEVMMASPSFPYDALVIRNSVAIGFAPSSPVNIVNDWNWKALSVRGVGGSGAGIELLPQGTGGRKMAIFSSDASNGPGAGKFVIWDELNGSIAQWP